MFLRVYKTAESVNTLEAFPRVHNGSNVGSSAGLWNDGCVNCAGGPKS